MFRFKRRNKLPKPGLQLRFTLIFVGTTALTSLLQYLLFADRLAGLALRLPNDGMALLQASSGLLAEVIAVSFLLFVPLTLIVGVLTTFRLAGPVYRIESYLRSVERGERPGPCTLRRGDQLQELCELVNRVTAPLREGAPREAVRSTGPTDLEAAPSLRPVRDQEGAGALP